MTSVVLIGCPTCGRRYRYDALRFGVQGVRIRCRTCESVMRVDIPHGLRPETRATTKAAPSRRAELASPSRSHGHGPPAAFPDAPGPTAKESSPWALVADRDPELRILAVGVLREQGFDVQTVDDGLAARRAMSGRTPQLVVLNTFLPHLLGVTLCAEMRKDPRLKSTRIVLMGSLFSRQRFVRSPEALYGADAFIDGRGSAAEIRAALQQAIGSDPQPRVPGPGEDNHEAVSRLARTVVGDILLYNPEQAARGLETGHFLESFAHEIRQGERMVARRFPDLPDSVRIYREAVEKAMRKRLQPATGTVVEGGGR